MPASSHGRDHSRRSALLAWLGVLLCCALLWGSENLLKRRQQLAVTEDVERRARFAFLLHTLYSYINGSGETFEAELNHGRPLAPLPSPDGISVRGEWDASNLNAELGGWTIQLTFRPGPAGARSRGSLEYAKTIAPPARYEGGPSPATLVAMENTRRAALLMAAGAWWLAFVTIPFARPWRRHLAQVCLAAAMLAAVAWLADPLRNWHRADWVAPLPIAIAASAFVGLVALALPVRKRTFAGDQAPCAHCGYDLTGNESGTCPECGCVTPKGRAERWQDLAARFDGGPTSRDGSEPHIAHHTDYTDSADPASVLSNCLPHLAAGPQGRMGPRMELHLERRMEPRLERRKEPRTERHPELSPHNQTPVSSEQPSSKSPPSPQPANQT